jgi:hypothetical protein
MEFTQEYSPTEQDEKTILIVEDDSNIGLSLCEILSQETPYKVL